MKHYAFLFLVPLAFLPMGCKKKEQPPKESVDFDKGFSISSAFNDADSKLEITLHLGDTLHAYAPGEKIGKPVKLEITELNGWQSDGPLTVPTAKKKNLGDLGESTVLEGEVKLSQKLKKGHGKGEALLYLQVCSRTACDRPRVHRLPLLSGTP